MLDMQGMRPPWSGLGKRLESQVRKALFDYQMLETEEPLGLALSGGKDSLTLLAILKAILGRGFPNAPLHAFHVSGDFSCGASQDLGYLHHVCEQLEVPLHVAESRQKLETLACYPCSRERRRLLFDMARQAGVETIAFGHHRDDAAQTLLMNLLHKAEFAGLLPKIFMEDYGVTILRPLIYVEEASIRTFAQQQGFARVMCRCPVGQNSMRRKVDQLLEDMEDLFDHARQNIAQAGLVYGSDKASRAR